MSSEILFTSLGLAEPLLRAVSEAGYTIPTPIQAKAIPLVLAGGDLLAAAQTGTGKTAGFTLPVLHRLLEKPAENSKGGRPRCLILTPTRELAAQVEESVKTYGKHTNITSMAMFGGVAINPQMQALRKRLDILVATPGRLLDHVGQRSLDLSGVEILILDEADRMLDMGFIRDIKKILALLPKKRQNLLFSATFSDEIRTLADGLLNSPGCVEVAPRNSAIELTTQTVHLVPQKQKKELLAHLIKQKDWFQVLVFTRTKHGANKLAEYLNKQGIKSSAIHGNKSQGARTRALADFKAGAQQVLVATDIAARGLDIDQLPQVVNFELPNVPEDYVHRIGRTGRAGSTGGALSLVDREEIPFLKAIERLTKREIERISVEGFVPSAPSAADDQAEARPPRQHHGRGNGQPRREGTTQGAGQGRGDGAGRGNGQARRPGASSNNRNGSAPARQTQGSPQTARQSTEEPNGNRAAPKPGSGNRPQHAPSAPRAHAPRPAQSQQPRAALFSSKPVNGNR